MRHCAVELEVGRGEGGGLKQDFQLRTQAYKHTLTTHLAYAAEWWMVFGPNGEACVEPEPRRRRP